MRRNRVPSMLATLLALVLPSVGAADVRGAMPTPSVLVPNRTPPVFIPAPALPKANFSSTPTDAEISQVRAFEESLQPTAGTGNAEENRALATTLAAHQAARLAVGPSNSSEVDLSAFEAFVVAHPHSIWSVSLLTNLGVEYYHRGQFTKALNAWRAAWQNGKAAPAMSPVKPLVDRALGELARMLARLGRTDELDALFTEVGDRPVTGLGAEAYHGAQGGLWNMRHKPEDSFKCGPWALDSILSTANPAHPYRGKLKQVASTDHGLSLSFVAGLAKEMQMDLVPAKRTGGGKVPTPAVVHWKLGHYGALLKHEGNRYLLQDPTFGSSQWIGQAALDEESSNYFLVPSNTLAADQSRWHAVGDSEAGKIWGRGFPSGYPPPPATPSPPPTPNDSPVPNDPTNPQMGGPGGDQGGNNGSPNNGNGGDPGEGGHNGGGGDNGGGDDGGGGNNGDGGDNNGDGCGMARWHIGLSQVDLQLFDIPLFYKPPVGPMINFQASYEQREANQPATFNFSNLGNKWNLNWVTTLTFDSNNAYVNYGRGGQETFANFTGSSQSSGVATITHNRLVRVSANVYQLVSANGATRVFDLTDGAGRYYMTKVTDPQGNAVLLGYDNQYRLMTVTDAIGQVSTFSYELAADPLKITKITDPFGRTVIFDYDTNNHLAQITDAESMTSGFSYNSDLVTQLRTGYGATNFSSTEVGLDRTLVVTLPDGSQEKAQSLGGSSGIPSSDPVSKVPQGMLVLDTFLDARNTSFWDRKAMLEAPNDVTKARIYHYLHYNNLTKGPILESMKMPFENRVWFYYQGQQQPGFTNTDGVGMLDTPSMIGRVLDDGTTQLYSRTSNVLGFLTKSVDPLGRTRKYVYDTNNVDLVRVTQATSLTTSDVLFQATYNAHHRPLTKTDAAGQTTRYTYNAAGQPLTITDAKNQVTTCIYDANGYLQSVTGPRAGETGSTVYTYDSYGRVKTKQDALGYVVTYAYDKLNRRTSITYPDGTSDQWFYTLLKPTQYTDRRNRNTIYTYDSLRQLVAVKDPLNRTVKFDYCRCGAVKSITDALNRTTRFTHDVQSRLTGRIYPDGSGLTYIYEATTSRVKSITDSKGQSTVFQYNPDNSLQLKSYAQALIPTPSVRYEYDTSYLRPTAMVDGTGMTRYAYYPVTSAGTLGANRIASVSSPFGQIIYGYDELGRMNSRTIDGTAEGLTFTSLDMPATLTNALGSFTLGYLGGNNTSRQLTSIAYPNGQEAILSYYPNNGDRRLQEILYQKPGGATLSSWDYTYDAHGEITNWTQQRDANPARVFTPGYDDANQLTSVAVTNPTQSFGYGYDVARNRETESINGVTTTASYNSLNELFGHSNPMPSDRTYEWDAVNRLVAINYSGTNNRTEFSYDGIGRRVQVVEKSAGSVTSTKRYLWEGLRIAEEKDASGQLVKQFWGPGVKILSGSSPGSYFYTRDHLGSVRELTDGSGTVRARYDYDPWGRATKTGGDLDADFGFAGYFIHGPSGLALTLFRAYDAQLGRWISRDPIGFRGGPNLYCYVDNQPMQVKDPFGLCTDKKKNNDDGDDDPLWKEEWKKVQQEREQWAKDNRDALNKDPTWNWSPLHPSSSDPNTWDPSVGHRNMTPMDLLRGLIFGI